jgi:hypothetical protein
MKYVGVLLGATAVVAHMAGMSDTDATFLLACAIFLMLLFPPNEQGKP